MDYLIYTLISLATSIIVYIVMKFVVFSNRKKIKELKKEISVDDVKTYEDVIVILNKILKKVNENDRSIIKLDDICRKIDNKYSFSYKNTGLVRYKYSDDAGGNLSFSLALMDDHKNGIVLTEISLIDSNSLYVRHITNGVSDILLMDEEVEAIRQATEKSEK